MHGERRAVMESSAETEIDSRPVAVLIAFVTGGFRNIQICVIT